MGQNDKDIKEESFASLFEDSLTRVDKFERGQVVETKIFSISADCIFLQLSGKSEGILDRDELTDKDGNLTVKEGDEIKVFFLHEKNGELNFTTRLSADKADPSMLENAFKNDIPVEGLVEKEIKGGYEVKIGATRAFCPYSQMGQRRTEDSNIYVGKRLTFKIQEFKENGRNILVSNRAILEEAHNGQIEALKKTLKENSVITGVIRSIQDFGAFVDIEGIQALLPISEISRNRVEDIHSVLTIGQEIEAKIIKIDWKSERISLSLKSLLSDPWETAEEKYPKDSKHTGKVVRITNFGAFISLEGGLDGLVHISELKGEDKRGNPSVTVKLGDELRVQVLDVDAKKKRISLKQATTFEEDETSKKYLETEMPTDTYNPFAALLKKGHR